MADEILAGTAEPVDLAVKDSFRVWRDAAYVHNGVEAIRGVVIGEVGCPLPVDSA